MPNEPEGAASDSADVSSAAEAELTAGTIINDIYKVVSLIGRGGMGAVYRVHQQMLGKDFALKVLNLQQATDAAVRRFQQEARTASQLQHPNLVEVHDFGVFGVDQPYLVMDFVEGVSLAQVLKNKGSLPTDFVIELCIQLCFGLMYAHEKGVVHRDIKPGNIMLLHPEQEPREGTVKIVDFGIAKLVQSDGGEIQNLTKTGEIFGSPLYMSPEQCKGDPIDKRSDIYSLGCVIFECLTGSPPFFGDTAMSTMMKRLSESPVSLKEGSLGRDFPQGLEIIVRKMLALEPGARYQELGAVVKDLLAVQTLDGGTVDGQSPVKIEERSRRREFYALLVALALLSVVFTMGVDAYVIFPEQVKIDTARLEKEELEAEFGKMSIKQLKETKLAKQNALVIESNSATKKIREELGRQDPQYPYLKTIQTKSGVRQYLVCPYRVGDISVNNEPLAPATGKILLPSGSSIILYLNKSASADPNLLKNLTGQKFALLAYGSSVAVTNDSISILKNIPRLQALKIEGAEVDSLQSLYDNDFLSGLEVMNTLIPISELLKLRRLKQLTYLTFGPTKNPNPLFEVLASSKIQRIHFKAAKAEQDKDGHLIKQIDANKLAKLRNIDGLGIESAVSFTDDDFEKLVPLKNLKAIVFRNCGITSKSLKTFRRFPNLELVKISRAGWSEKEIAELRRFVKKVEVSGSRDDMRQGINNTWSEILQPLKTDR